MAPPSRRAFAAILRRPYLANAVVSARKRRNPQHLAWIDLAGIGQLGFEDQMIFAAMAGELFGFNDLPRQRPPYCRSPGAVFPASPVAAALPERTTLRPSDATSDFAISRPSFFASFFNWSGGAVAVAAPDPDVWCSRIAV